MGSVTFYKAPIINETNRFRRSKIAAYLATCASVTYSVDGAEVQPNVPFFIKDFFTGIQDAAQYNYIGYENAGVNCYALILDVSQVSSNLSEGLLFKIFHVIDVIATYGDGVFDDINGIYASGIMSRGHVNDWEMRPDLNDAVPTIAHTLAAPEEIVNNANIRYTRFTPDLKYTPRTVTTTSIDYMNGGSITASLDLTIFAYLLVYISNTSAVTTESDSWGRLEVNTLGGETHRLPIQGTPVLYGLGASGTSSDIFGVYVSGYSTYTRFYIADLKNSNITSMCLLPLIWDPDTYYSGSNFLVSAVSTRDTEAAGGLTKYLPVFNQHISSVNFKSELEELGYYLPDTQINELYCGVYYVNAGWSITQAADYDLVMKSVYSKLRTAPYFNIQIEDTAIISVFWDATYEYQAALDCSGFLIHCNWTNTTNDYSIISTTNLGMFAPAVINDYWTRLDATQESILATINQTQNVMNVVSSSVNFAVQGVSGVAGAATGGMTAAGAAGASGGILGAATGLIGSIATYGDKKQYYSNQQEIAEHQAQVGLTKDVAVLGTLQLQDSYVVPAIKCQYLTDTELIRLGELIHRKGYVTNIPLTEVPEHVRFNYNYIQSTDYNIGGLPISVARELQDLFARGVWVWHTIKGGGFPKEADGYKVTDEYSKYVNPIGDHSSSGVYH
ncbi:MAG: hypothetical protein LUC16_01450 [Coprobacillus sp.]|nr:hypothetical protein [Coprobacillus sp.]